MKLIPTTTPTAHWLTDFDRLFDRFFSVERTADDEPGDFIERDDSWLLRVDLPGFRKDEVKLSTGHDTLELHASTEDEERPFRSEVRRTWALGDDVAADAIEGRLENGVLEITLPKRDPAETHRTIEIH